MIAADSLITPANRLTSDRCVGGRFPHMGPLDSAVWRAFLDCKPIEFKRTEYDVTVGGRSAAKVKATDGLRPMWLTLIRKRIDAVCWTADDVWTVEVKPAATMSALGQALTYRHLWIQDTRPKKEPRAVVICARCDDDLAEVFTAYGVTVICVSGSEPGETSAIVRVVGSPLW